MKTALVSLLVFAFFCASSGAQTGEHSALEQRYCTQSGPFMIRFDKGSAAGFFAALPEYEPTNTPGAMAGDLSNQTLHGVWVLTNKRGFIRIEFSEDWSSFIAAYALEGDAENWRSGWMGYLPPAGDPPTFIIDSDRFYCE